MLDVKALKAEMVRNGYTQAKLADALGITPRTLNTRMKTGDFGSKEIEIMISLLKLKDPMEIFFANKVT
ncbi:MAG: helix-turn-helix transcriptional regulator [Clostridia bacterium]|nr:helix-turn-helix transcriptional regulator [Clostridia bacterium]